LTRNVLQSSAFARAGRLALVAALAAGLSGCFGSAEPPPRDRYYRLLAGADAAPLSKPALKGILVVEQLTTDGLLLERPLLFTTSSAGNEVQQHDYHYWIDRPPNMVQQQIVEYLRARNVAKSIVTPRLRVDATYRLVGSIKRMERILGDGGNRVVVELELGVLRARDGRLIMIDTYREERPADAADIKSAVAAINAAFEACLDRFVTALAG